MTIITLTGDNGLLKKAASAKGAVIIGEENEKIRLGYNEYMMNLLNGEERDLIVEDALVTKNNSNWEIQFNETQHQYTLFTDGTIIENNQESGNVQEKIIVNDGELEVTFNSPGAQNIQMELSDMSDNEAMSELYQEIIEAVEDEDHLKFIPNNVKNNIPENLSNINETSVLSISNYFNNYGNGQFVIRFDTSFQENNQFVTLLIIKNDEDEYEYFVLDAETDSEGCVIFEIPANILEKMNGNPTAIIPISQFR